MIHSKLIASGSYLPEKLIKNIDLDPSLETSDEWITTRTGIKQRYIAADDQVTSDLAAQAIRNTGVDLSTIDGIIVATTTPDVIFPSTAINVQNKLGIHKGFAFDINAVCAGFVYALAVADGMIKNKTAKRIAVVGAETMSRVLDWKDRATCVLFGDGAGAFILEASTEQGIIDSSLDADSSKADILKVCGGISTGNMDAKVEMNGKEVFKTAVDSMSSSLKNLLEKNNINMDDLDWVLPHQANQRILSAVATRLGAPEEKVMSTVGIHANTSAASIPLAYDHYKTLGKVKSGQLIALSGIGAGMTWGSVLLRT
jgi:3-oxoacyl-[acyl-carrier-protein] synthase III